ncbi:MAG: aminopeptidase [Candidatus Woesearchaeota archaeon]
MVDSRIKRAAKILVDYSTKVKKGDRVIIAAHAAAEPLVLEIYKLCLQKGAHPVIRTLLSGANYIFFKYAKDHQLRRFPVTAMYEIKQTDVYISISATCNTREFASIDPNKIALRSKIMSPISRWRSEKTRWVLFDYPTNALAQEAGMSYAEYEDFVYSAVNQNWNKIKERLAKLASVVDKAKEVRIVGKDTDLKFTILHGKCATCDGLRNMPGGEIFTVPDKYSAEGYIYFDYPAVRNGNIVRGIRLEFKDGKVVKANAENNKEFLQAMLHIDSGASYLGEFGIGCNKNITKYTNNTLFDEKIGGTIHIALGNAYRECNGKNKSALHWDLVKDLRQNGAIYLDGKLFQKNGRFRL